MIFFQKHSGIYSMIISQELNISLEATWLFFSNPANLSKITPQQMGFKITNGKPETMYEGQIISYKVSPFPGFKTNWVTEITHVVPNQFFIDEQRFGPYSMWHHEHHFKTENGKVVMTDKLYYKPPLGFLGQIVNTLFVKKKIKEIFLYREQVLNKLFN